MNNDQYHVVCARRQAFDGLVWQVPSLAIAGQSFLLATALNAETSAFLAMVLSALASIVGCASFQLMHKHRQLEKEDSERLVRFEKKNSAKGYSRIHGGIGVDGMERNRLTSLSSFKIWSFMLILFVVAGVFSFSLAWRRVDAGGAHSVSTAPHSLRCMTQEQTNSCPKSREAIKTPIRIDRDPGHE